MGWSLRRRIGIWNAGEMERCERKADCLNIGPAMLDLQKVDRPGEADWGPVHDYEEAA